MVLNIIKNNNIFKTGDGYNTRQKFNIKILTMHKNLTQTTYLYIGPTVYNKFLLEINYTNSLKKKIYIYKYLYILTVTKTNYNI